MAIGLTALLMLQIASPLPPPPFNSGLAAGAPRGPDDEFTCLEHKRTHRTYCATRAEWRFYAKQMERKRSKAAAMQARH